MTDPNDIDSLLVSAAQENGLDPETLRAMANTESTGNPNAVSPKGAGGVMQLMPGTAQMLGVKNIFDPAENIKAGARYYKMLLTQYNGDEDKALAAYDAGPGKVNLYGGVPPYKETQDYLNRIKARRAMRANTITSIHDDVDDGSNTIAHFEDDTPAAQPSQPSQPSQPQQQRKSLAESVAAEAPGYEHPTGTEQLGLPQAGVYQPTAKQITQAERRAAGQQLVSKEEAKFAPGAPKQPWYEHTPRAAVPQDDFLLDRYRGALTMGKGAKQIYQAMPSALPNQTAGQPAYGPTNYPLAAQGLANVVGGGMEIGAPLIGEGLMTAPVRTAVSLAAGVGGSELTEHLARKANVPEAYIPALSLAGGILAGGIPGWEVVRNLSDRMTDYVNAQPMESMTDQQLKDAYAREMIRRQQGGRRGSVSDEDLKRAYANEVIRRQNLAAGVRGVEGPQQQPQQPQAAGPLFEEPQQQPQQPQQPQEQPQQQPQAPVSDLASLSNRELLDYASNLAANPPSDFNARAAAVMSEVQRRQAAGTFTPEAAKPAKPAEPEQQPEPEEPEQPEPEPEPEPEQPEDQPAEGEEDPVAWARAQLEAGNEIGVGAIQRKFGLGYGKAREALRTAMTPEEEVRPDTMEPYGREPEPEPEPEAKEEERVGVDTGGEGGERGAVSPAVPGALYTPGSRIGKETLIHLPGTKLKLRARYVWAPIEELEGSHSGLDFSPNPNSPVANEREYTLPEAQKRVMDQAEDLEPAYLHTDNPDMVNGPPAWEEITHPETQEKRKAVLAGNSREMTAERAAALHPDQFEKLNQDAREKLANFGIDPAVVDDPNDRRPHMLTRQLYPLDEATRKAALAAMNKTGTAAMSPEERAMADSKRVSPKTLEYIVNLIDKGGEDATLASILKGPQGGEIADKMVDDGLISDRERASFVTVDDKNNRVLTPEGEARIQRLMIGRFFEDVPQLNMTPVAIRNKLAAMAPSLASLENRPDWDLINGPLRGGLRVLREAQNRGVTKLEDLAAQMDLNGKRAYTDQEIAWAYALLNKQNTPRAFRQAARAYAEMEMQSRPGREQDMFAPPPVERNDAYRQAWGNLRAAKGTNDLLIGGKAPPKPKKPKAPKEGQPGVQAEYEPPEVQEARNQPGLFDEEEQNPKVTLFGPTEGERVPPAKPPSDQPSLVAPREGEVKREQEANDAALLKARLEAQFRSGMAMRPGQKGEAPITRNLFGADEPDQPRSGNLFDQPSAPPAPPAKPPDNTWAQDVKPNTFDPATRAWSQDPSTTKITNSAEQEIVRRGMLTPDAMRQMRKRLQQLILNGPVGDQPHMGTIYARELQKYLRGEPSAVNSGELPGTLPRTGARPADEFQQIPGPVWSRRTSEGDLIRQARIEHQAVGPNHYPALKVNGQAMDLIMQILMQDATGYNTKGFAVGNHARSIWDRDLSQKISTLNSHLSSLRDPRDIQAVTELRTLLTNLRNALNEQGLRSNHGHILVYQAGTDRTPDQIKSTVDHELDHLVQYHATGADISTTQPHVGPGFYNHPLIQLADAYLRQNPGYRNYPPQGMALEIGARLMQPGAWKQLGLTDKQAEEAGLYYAEHLTGLHGRNRVVNIADRVYNAIGHEPAILPSRTPDAGTASPGGGEPQGSTASQAGGRGRGGAGLPAQGPGDLFGNDPGTRVEHLAESTPPEDENPVEVLRQVPGPLDEQPEAPKPGSKGFVLGGGLGALQPQLAALSNKIRQTYRQDMDSLQATRKLRQQMMAAVKKGQVLPADAVRGQDLRYFTSGVRDLWAAGAMQQLDQWARNFKTEKERQALFLYRDFKNRPGQLEQWRDGTHPEIPGNAGWPNDPVLRAEFEKNRKHVLKKIEELKPAIALALNPTQQMKDADSNLTRMAGQTLREGQKRGFLDSTIAPEDYTPHMYTEEDENKPLDTDPGTVRGNLTRRFAFGEERQHPTVFKAMAAGLTPRTLDPFAAFAIHADKFATARAARMTADALKQATLGVWASSPNADNIPANWVPTGGRDSSAFQIRTPAGTMQMYSPKWVAEGLRPITQSNALRSQIPGFDWLRKQQSIAKGIELSWSAYHLASLNMAALNNMTSLARPVSFGEAGRGFLDAYFRDQRQDPEFQKWERDLIGHGGRTAVQGKMLDAYHLLKPGSVPTLADVFTKAPVMHQLDQAAKSITEFTFGRVQRHFKVLDYANKVEQWQRENPNANQSATMAAKRSIAREINSTYGDIHWENLGFAKAAQDLARATMLAPDWNFSNYYLGKQVGERPQGSKGWQAFRGTPGAQAARKYWLNTALYGFVLTQLTSAMLNKKFNSADEVLHHPFEIKMGTDRQGRTMWSNMYLRGAGGDAYKFMHDAVSGDPAGAAGRLIYNKLAPYVRPAMGFLTGRDYLGKQIVNQAMPWMARWGRRAYTGIGDFAPVPFALRNLLEQKLGARKKEYTWDEALLMMLGLSAPYKHEAPKGMRYDSKTDQLMYKAEPPEPPDLGFWGNLKRTGEEIVSNKP